MVHLDQGTEDFQLTTNGKELDGTVAVHQNTNGEKLDSIRTGQDAMSVVFPQKIDQEELDGTGVGPEGEVALPVALPRSRGTRVGPEGEVVLIRVILAGT